MTGRFFPGYTWVSDDPDCRLGLCMPSVDREQAAMMFLDRYLVWRNRNRTFTVWTMQGEGETPVQVSIRLEEEHGRCVCHCATQE